ncbi:hypothetical protein AciM339_1229 [Aciduliprofundum sp. MAR08-339]|uniref:hypothetical protein n=1 Tax=Aciduliprofundum sp. (strain MAR08-339) TaxID=673860 RepID=UPI0002A4A2CF|nr:hypothetical protein AciM339_1229 [Aciduliprofundum sp. MAR08-339]
MGSYTKGIIGTGVGLALLVFSPKIGGYLYSKFEAMGGITIPFVGADITSMIFHAVFSFIVILVGLEIILVSWK